MQPNAELLKYIQEQTGQGWSLDQILPELRSFGWPEEEIRVALQWIESEPQPTPAQGGVLPIPAAPEPEPPEPSVPEIGNQQYPSEPPIADPAAYQTTEMNSFPVYPASAPQTPTLQTSPEQAPAQPTATAEMQASTVAIPPTQPMQSFAAAPIMPPQNFSAPAPVEAPQPMYNVSTPTVVQPTTEPQPTPPALQAVTAITAVPAQQPQPASGELPPALNAVPGAANAAQTSNTPNAQSLTALLQPARGRIGLLSRYKRTVSLVFATIAITLSVLLFWSLFHENSQTTLKKTIQKSLLSGTFERDYTNVSAGDGLKVHAKLKSDFTNTTQPKTSGTMEATLEFGPESTVIATYDLVAVEDTIWLRATNIDLELSETTRNTYQQLAQGTSVESTISSLIGIGNLNQWTEYSYNPSYVTAFGLSYNLVRLGFALNSPLAEFPVANANTHNNTAVSLVLNSGMITVDYKDVSSESADSKRYKVYKMNYNSKDFSQTAKNLAELLDLSQRHRDAISEKDIAVEDGEAKLWIDDGAHLPYKLDAPRDGTVIIFSNFGGNFDIKSPL